MIIEILLAAVAFSLIALAAVWFFNLQINKEMRRQPTKKADDEKNKMYEMEILNELGDKMDYSLDVQSVIETITGSLHRLMEYSTVSYMLLSPEKIVFRVSLEKPVSRDFVDSVKIKMIDSISALLGEDFKNKSVEETLWGTVSSGEIESQVSSFFNIPLVVSGKLAGLLNVADTRAGFFKEEEMTTLYKIAKQASAAVTRLQGVVESEKSKLNAMVSSMADGVLMTDIDYRVLVVNPTAKKAFGFKTDKDLEISDFTGELDKYFDLKDKIEESIRLDKIFFSEEISLQGGFFKIIVSPVKNSWKTQGCVVVFRDINREKEVEKIKDDFTSMIVHELRSPLDSIKKMIELIRVSKVAKSKQSECLQMIYGSSSEMLELVNNLLDMAKIEAGKFTLFKQLSSIKEIIASRVSFFDISAKDAKVKLESNFSQDVPDKVNFDPHTISQVLNNLISNALKFNKENGSVVIQALLHKKGGSILAEAKTAKIDWFIKNDIADIPDSLFVAVTNSGEGIAEDQINKLFNKFFQVKSVFAQKGGTGLGLAITKSIIDSHGGLVGAESVEGQGATFYFTIPLNL